jgi:hypothetical protein
VTWARARTFESTKGRLGRNEGKKETQKQGGISSKGGGRTAGFQGGQVSRKAGFQGWQDLKKGRKKGRKT